MSVINITETDSINIEYYIHHIFSLIFKIREALKNDIIKTNNKNEITGELVEPYAKYQEKYTKLRDITIDTPLVKGFSDFFRNRIEHGGNMMFSIKWKSVGQYVIYSAICDYGMLAERDSLSGNIKDNLYQYYFDIFISFMQDLAHGIPHSYFTSEQIQEINFDLKARLNNKHVEISTLTIDEIQSLVNKKDFILSNYNLWIKRNNCTIGQFGFDLSECIGNIYKAHINLYEQLYNWVADCQDSNIKEFLQIQDDICESHTDQISISKITFDLQIDKSIFRNS